MEIMSYSNPCALCPIEDIPLHSKLTYYLKMLWSYFILSTFLLNGVALPLKINLTSN
jgi:hypothetical protein